MAAQVGFEVFVRPALLAMAGHVERYRPTVQARLTSGWVSPPGRREFVPVTLVGSPEDGYRAAPLGGPGEMLLGAMAAANGLAVVPVEAEHLGEGDPVTVLVLES